MYVPGAATPIGIGVTITQRRVGRLTTRIVYLILQEQLTGGIAVGAVKG